jgi:hypothetical protein
MQMEFRLLVQVCAGIQNATGSRFLMPRVMDASPSTDPTAEMCNCFFVKNLAARDHEQGFAAESINRCLKLHCLPVQSAKSRC